MIAWSCEPQHLVWAGVVMGWLWLGLRLRLAASPSWSCGGVADATPGCRRWGATLRVTRPPAWVLAAVWMWMLLMRLYCAVACGALPRRSRVALALASS